MKNEKGRKNMKIVLVRPPRILRPLLRKICGVGTVKKGQIEKAKK